MIILIMSLISYWTVTDDGEMQGEMQTWLLMDLNSIPLRAYTPDGEELLPVEHTHLD